MLNLRDQEERCTQEHAPACAAACPAHVDAKAIVEHILRGGYQEAFRVFAKSAVFPRIVSSLCDRPCERRCKRAEAGGSIRVRLLEQACTRLGGERREPRKPLRRREARAAVVGGGLSGLSAALGLYEKGYRVVLYERAERLGGRVLSYAGSTLQDEDIEEDLAVLSGTDIEVRLAEELELAGGTVPPGFDAVAWAGGAAEARTGRRLDWLDPEAADPLTLQLGNSPIFVGGSVLRPTGAYSPIASIADGRRLANSIDRYLKKVSLTAGRELEGAYETRLYCSLAGVVPAGPVDGSDRRYGYTQEEALREAERCLLCTCLECVKACEYLKEFEGYPKKYIREISNNLSIVFGFRMAKSLVNSCSLCGLCTRVCPFEIGMAEVCSAARREMVAKGNMPPAIHDFPLRDMEFSNGEAASAVLVRPGTHQAAFLFFPGCQLSASEPAYVRTLYRALSGFLRAEVAIALRCCGAPALWAGRSEAFDQAVSEFRAIWKSLGSPPVITACTSCSRVLGQAAAEIPQISLWKLLEEHWKPDEPVSARKQRRLAAIHDPCTSRDQPAVRASVRSILQRGGYEIQELAFSGENTTCCGFGGLMRFANPPLGDKVIARRVKESPLPFVAYCSVCRDLLAEAGKEVWHALDVVLGNDTIQKARSKGPGYSARWENRLRLKRALVKDLTGNDGGDMGASGDSLRLILAEGVAEILEKRLILMEDLREVIRTAEENGSGVVDPATGHISAHARPRVITYWVEYSKAGDNIVVRNAYSHRLKIVEGGK